MMNFAELLLSLLTRIAKLDIAHESITINQDGVLELELLAIVDGEVAPLGWLTENATDAEVAAFNRQLDLLEKASAEQKIEDEKQEALVRAVLNKLTPDERALIDRPLPEDAVTIPPQAEVYSGDEPIH